MGVSGDASQHSVYSLLGAAGRMLVLWLVMLSAQAQLPPQVGPEQLLSQGAVHYSRGDYDKATRYLYQYVDIAPNYTAARKLLAAAILRLQEQTTQAMDVLQALPEAVWRDDEQYRALLATAQLAAGDDINGLNQLHYLGTELKEPVDTHLTLRVPAKNTDRRAADFDPAAPGALLTVVELGPGLIPNRLIDVFGALAQGHYGGAVVAVDELLRGNRHSPLYNHMAGLVHAEHNNLERARGFWEDARRYGRPPLLSTLLELARLATYFGDYPRALELLEQAAQRAPQQSRIILAQAEYWIQTDSTERAQALLADAWLTTGIRDIVIKLIELELQQGDYKAALQHAEALEARYPDWPESLLNLGIALLLNGHLGSALQQFQQLAQRQPDSARPWYLMATVSMRAQDYSTALESLNQAITIEPEYLPARLLRAEVYLLSEAYEDALAEARAVQAIAAPQGTGYKLEGDIHVARGEFSAAVDAYAQAHEKSPSMQTTLLLNHAQQLTGAQDDAITTLRNWLAITSDADSVRLQLAMQLEQAGQYADAIQEYERTLKTDPNNLIALNNLAWLLRDTEAERALALAEHALSLSAERPEILDTMGWLLVNSGQQERGLRLLQQAAMLAPHLPLIRYHQALAYEQTQRYSEALEVLAEVSTGEMDATLREQVEQLYERLRAKQGG